MHLWQFGFTYIACKRFNKCKERIKKIIITNKTIQYIFNGDFSELPRRPLSDKVLSNINWYS